MSCAIHAGTFHLSALAGCSCQSFLYIYRLSVTRKRRLQICRQRCLARVLSALPFKSSLDGGSVECVLILKL